MPPMDRADAETLARVAQSIAEADDARGDPFTLARLTVRGTAGAPPGEGATFASLKARWLAKFPARSINFTLADFSFWRIVPIDARFIAGYGRIHNQSAQALREAIEEPS